MDIKALSKDFKNKGGYKTKITNNQITIIDSNSVVKMETHINKITDTLFLGLSRGMRIPAMYTGEATYNSITDSWDVKNNLNKGSNFLQSAVVNKSGDQILSMTLTFDGAILNLSDSTPLYFVYNTSTLGDYENDYVLFPRISDIVNNVVTVAMESNNAGTWGYYESSLNGEEGLSVGIDCLLQSTGEGADTAFYTPGIPDWTYDSAEVWQDAIYVNGYIYNTIIETSDLIDWPCKAKGRIIKWSGDCVSGSAWPGATYAYSTEQTYRTGKHILKFLGLDGGNLYKVWVQIDSEIGQDNLEWQLVDCFYTTAQGEGDIHNG